MHIVTPALSTVGINTGKRFSTSSLYGARKAVRYLIGDNSRLLPVLDGANFNCLPVVVSGKDVEKLLDIKIHGTAIIMGTTIVK